MRGLGGGDGEVTLAVTGMSCASCSSKVQSTLQVPLSPQP